MIDEQQWWGHNKEHGWVVLDRTLYSNRSGQRSELRFLRCRDQETFTLKREKWDEPAFMYAPNYLRKLPADESAQAAGELDALKQRWPEMGRVLHEQFGHPEKPVEAAANQTVEAAPPKKKSRAPVAKKATKAKMPVIG